MLLVRKSNTESYRNSNITNIKGTNELTSKKYINKLSINIISETVKQDGRNLLRNESRHERRELHNTGLQF